MTEKLFFLGTPSFAANILDGILDKGINVAGVITGPDKKQGRGHKVSESAVAKATIKHNIATFKPNDTNELENILANNSPTLCLVIAYGMIFPEHLVSKYNFINIHGSLLPKYRGPSPIQSCLLNGDKISGVTLMKIGKGIDDGDMITAKTTTIDPTETAGSLFEKLESISTDLLVEHLPRYKNWGYTKQDSSEATHTKKIKKEDGKVDLSKDNPTAIYQKYQAFMPWPGIYTYQNEQRIKLVEIELEENLLKIINVQKEGKKTISYSDFLNSNEPLI